MRWKILYCATFFFLVLVYDVTSINIILNEVNKLKQKLSAIHCKIDQMNLFRGKNHCVNSSGENPPINGLILPNKVLIPNTGFPLPLPNNGAQNTPTGVNLPNQGAYQGPNNYPYQVYLNGNQNFKPNGIIVPGYGQNIQNPNANNQIPNQGYNGQYFQFPGQIPNQGYNGQNGQYLQLSSQFPNQGYSGQNGQYFQLNGQPFLNPASGQNGQITYLNGQPFYPSSNGQNGYNPNVNIGYNGQNTQNYNGQVGTGQNGLTPNLNRQPSNQGINGQNKYDPNLLRQSSNQEYNVQNGYDPNLNGQNLKQDNSGQINQNHDNLTGQPFYQGSNGNNDQISKLNQESSPSLNQSNVRPSEVYKQSANSIVFPDSDLIITPNPNTVTIASTAATPRAFKKVQEGEASGRKILYDQNNTTVANQIKSVTESNVILTSERSKIKKPIENHSFNRRKNNDDYEYGSEYDDDDDDDDNKRKKKQRKHQVFSDEVTSTTEQTVTVKDGKSLAGAVRSNCGEGFVADKAGVCREVYK